MSAIALGFVGVSSQASAQTSADFDRQTERIEERERERQRAREEELRARQTPPPSGVDAPLLDDKEPKSEARQCVSIRSVQLLGITRYNRDDFQSILNKLIGDCTGMDEINDALRTITNRYIAEGYVTSRALISPQDLNDGTLDITIVEGSISAINGEEAGYSARTLDFAFPGMVGKQLNLRAIEQGVDQLSRLSSFEPDIDIQAAAMQGASDIVVKRKKSGSIVRPSVSFDNDGSAATGRIQSTLSVDADNILGIADYWSLYYSRDLSDKPFAGSEGFGGFLSVPYGFWTLSLNGGYFSYKSVLEGNQQSFQNSGRSINGSATLDRMLFRDAKTKFSVSATLGLLDTENRIQGIRLSTSSYRLITGSIDWRLQKEMLDGLVSASIGLTRGLNMLGANAIDTGPGGPGLTFRKISASLAYQTRGSVWSIPLNYSMLVRGQSTLDPVFSGQRLSVGGSSTVRGFRDDGISGRHGVSMRQQVGFPLLALFKGNERLQSRLVGFVGYDAGGIVARKGDRFERGVLHSSTLGMRFQHRNIQGEFSASMPLSAPDFVKKNDVELAASLRISF